MLYVEKEWKPVRGSNTYCFCPQIVGKKYQQWIIPCRILDISPAEYAKLLTEEFNATVSYNPETKFMSKHWISARDASRWRLFINKKAREKNFKI